MKDFIFVLFIFFITYSSAYSTEYSKYISDREEKCLGAKTTITVKREHIEEYEQCIGSEYIPAIVYGYGDIKTKGLRKKRISYICLLNKELKPVWGCVIPR